MPSIGLSGTNQDNDQDYKHPKDNAIAREESLKTNPLSLFFLHCVLRLSRRDSFMTFDNLWQK
jgi:hypothetical protein